LERLLYFILLGPVVRKVNNNGPPDKLAWFVLLTLIYWIPIYLVDVNKKNTLSAG